MEESRKKDYIDKKENDIIFSKAIKAGKRIYYMDVKRNKKNELYLAITESKKIVSGPFDDPVINFEKHKIFLYKEDFDKFGEGLSETIKFIKKAMNPTAMEVLESEDDIFDKF